MPPPRILNPRRMYSTSLRYPDKIFSTNPPLPLPPPCPTTSTSSSPTLAPSSLQWKESAQHDKTLPRVLSNLQTILRSVHKRKVVWPSEESVSSSLSPSQYLITLLRPITNIFNQLHPPNVLKTPMECMPLDFGESIRGVTFIAEDFKPLDLTAPIIIYLPNDLFHASGKVSSHVDYALFKALEYKPSTPSIIVTNFEDIAVFVPPAFNHPEPTFERISTPQPSLALRVLSTAYLQNATFIGRFIDAPDPDIEIDEDLILPQGPPQDPHQPLLADEEVFASHHRHSDFDMATLVRDRSRALQFFRWHKHVQEKYSKLVALPNDTLTAVTNEIGQILPPIKPIYPFDFSEMPPDTTAHLEGTQRESPLVIAGIAESFEQCKSFTLKIQNIIAEGSKHGICTVYRCQITSIDNNIVSSPISLCLKLFDDRFQPVRSPDEGEEELDDEILPRWFDPVVIAEMYALNEAFAYDKLRPAQGSLVPWFYGTHQFTLPDGMILYGILMEFVQGENLDSDFVRRLSPDRQIKMIQSCRHAARVLDIADVSQRDWHNEQLLLCTNPTTNVDHAVLVDFASTTQTWEAHEPNFIQNYFDMLFVLLGRQGTSGLDTELVWQHYGEPDDWDPVLAFISKGPDQETKVVEGRDMFPYISLICYSPILQLVHTN